MSEGVVNWSRSDRVVRIHAPFGVSYTTEDLEVVQQIAIGVATSVERISKQPAPVCNLIALGTSSIDFDLQFWIEIPFPQQDLHIKNWPPQ
jgi:small-conductance mechanosensitive channel